MFIITIRSYYITVIPDGWAYFQQLRVCCNYSQHSRTFRQTFRAKSATNIDQEFLWQFVQSLFVVFVVFKVFPGIMVKCIIFFVHLCLSFCPLNMQVSGNPDLCKYKFPSKIQTMIFSGSALVIKISSLLFMKILMSFSVCMPFKVSEFAWYFYEIS